MNFEDASQYMLRHGTSLDVLGTQISHFEHVYGHAPTVVVVDSSLRASVLTVLVRRIGMPPDQAVAEPLFLGKTRVLFQKLQNGDYVICKSSKATVTL